MVQTPLLGAAKEKKSMINKVVMSMAALRMMSGSLEIIAALLMLRFNQVEKALLVNSGLALVGPMVLLTTTTIGLVGIAEKLSFGKMIWVLLGVSCIFIGILKK
jgi:putative exporter of polyketide antibiotics